MSYHDGPMSTVDARRRKWRSINQCMAVIVAVIITVQSLLDASATANHLVLTWIAIGLASYLGDRIILHVLLRRAFPNVGPGERLTRYDSYTNDGGW
jgi:hypothetical protein